MTDRLFDCFISCLKAIAGQSSNRLIQCGQTQEIAVGELDQLEVLCSVLQSPEAVSHSSSPPTAQHKVLLAVALGRTLWTSGAVCESVGQQPHQADSENNANFLHMLTVVLSCARQVKQQLLGLISGSAEDLSALGLITADLEQANKDLDLADLEQYCNWASECVAISSSSSSSTLQDDHRTSNTDYEGILPNSNISAAANSAAPCSLPGASVAEIRMQDGMLLLASHLQSLAAGVRCATCAAVLQQPWLH